MITVKQGDTHNITFTVNMDLTGATVRLLCRPIAEEAPTILASSITDASGGIVTHQLTGDLEPGRYYVELEVTKSGVIATAPSDGYETMRVIREIG